MCLFYFQIAKSEFVFMESGIHLLSHAVSSIVSSASQVLTIVFGMGTGVSPGRIATGIFLLSSFLFLLRPCADRRTLGNASHGLLDNWTAIQPLLLP